MVQPLEVAKRIGDKLIRLVFDERSVEMSHERRLRLKRGPNTLMVKSETCGREWRFYIQPPSLKGAVANASAAGPTIGLHGARNVDSKAPTGSSQAWRSARCWMRAIPAAGFPHRVRRSVEGGSWIADERLLKCPSPDDLGSMIRNPPPTA